MSLSAGRAPSLQLRYISHFAQNPDRHFLGFLRDNQTNDQNWDQTRDHLRNLFFQICWREVSPCIIKKSDALPLYFCDQKSCYTDKDALVGFVLLEISNDYTEKSRCIKKINRCVIQALFALPSRAGLEADASLLMRLSRDRINPDVPTLEELCVRTASYYFSQAQIKCLPILLQKTIISLQKEQELRGLCGIDF